jgi:hypothetical protein
MMRTAFTEFLPVRRGDVKRVYLLFNAEAGKGFACVDPAQTVESRTRILT